MTRQWLRECRISVDTGEEVIELSGLRTRFQVTQTRLQTPNAASITVSNVSIPTAKKFVKKEGQTVTLEVGYEEGTSILFKGQTIQARAGKESPVDAYLSFVAQSGDKAYNFAVVSKTLAAGSTFRDHVDVALEAMKPYGVTAGFIADLGSAKMPGPRTFFGMARDVLRETAFSTGTSWFIEDEKLVITKNNRPRPGDVIKINAETGMIGRPAQTYDGIIVRMLLNTRVRPDTRLEIDQSSIDEAAFSPDTLAVLSNSQFPSLADDGIYRVLVADHHGDTHGNAWYTEAICIRADGQGPQPIRLVQQGINIDPGSDP